MEDAVAVIPAFLQIQTHVLMDTVTDQLPDQVLAHFFGVYDGHGGCQVLFSTFQLCFAQFSDRIFMF